MIIAGGCYREVCDTPHWDALYGSGGRAATALVRLDPGVVLCTYCPQNLRASLYDFEAAGITVRSTNSRSPIAFAYFHPLSEPVVAPAPTSISQEIPLHVDGPAVLRFGFVEGDAIVNAKYAIYDPQSKAAQPFASNGSKAEQLAIVLNESELRSIGQADSLNEAASKVRARDNATLVIAKCGVRGAWLFQLHRDPIWIPAYRSTKVFKIGSGDVFSAAFSYYWAVEGRDARESADLASRSVAQYVSTCELPLESKPLQFAPVKPIQGSVHLVGSTSTLGNRWLCEEALWHLRSLGATVQSATNSINPSAMRQSDSVLILGNTLSDNGYQAVCDSVKGQLATVLFLEFVRPFEPTQWKGVQQTDDFTTALYWALWGTS